MLPLSLNTNDCEVQQIDTEEIAEQIHEGIDTKYYD